MVQQPDQSLINVINNIIQNTFDKRIEKTFGLELEVLRKVINKEEIIKEIKRKKEEEERLEKERIENERIEKERIEQERIENEKRIKFEQCIDN